MKATSISRNFGNMSFDEAKKILDVEEVDLFLRNLRFQLFDKVQSYYFRLETSSVQVISILSLQMNDKKGPKNNGFGSKYLQDKVLNAKERIDFELGTTMMNSMFVEALREGDFDYLLMWMKNNWTLSVYISLVYVILIFWGQSCMKTRTAFNLRPQLFLWSLGLAVFSIWGSYHAFNGIFSDAKENGWLYTMCSVSYLNENDQNRSPLWAFLFMFSQLGTTMMNSMFVEALREGDFDYLLMWMKNNWTLSVYISLVYVILIFWGQSCMKTRTAFNLRPQLFLWSLGLAVFSIWGSYHAFNGIFSDAKENGWLYTMCSVSYLNENDQNRSPLWAFLFMFSKLPELGDTIFIVLRKQKLIFLHWYHHITVFVYCWYSYPVGRWFSAINYMVHAIMYSYYAMRASGRRPPKFIPIGITTLQILQMFAGISVNLYAVKMLYSGESCYVGITHIVLSLSMYTSMTQAQALGVVIVEAATNKSEIKKEEADQAGSSTLRQRTTVTAQ
eukprot:sb/3464049/